MRTLVVIVALVSIAGAMKGAFVAQAGPLVFYRICNIEPSQDAAAVALSQKIVGLANRKHPKAQMTASKGRWMNGFQEIAQPVNQILFTEQHPNQTAHHDFTEALLDDDDFQVLQRKISGVIDVSSCVDTQFRASP